MSDLLGIGASGLRAYGRALSTVADNVANAQTPGYARRTLQMAELQGSGTSILYRSAINPGGVEITGIARAVERWLVEDARSSSGDASRTSTRLQWMNRVESTLSNDNNNIATSLTKVYTSADLLTADANNPTLRAQFLQAIEEVATGFRTTATQLTDIAQGVTDTATAEVNLFNGELQALEEINAGLRKARAGSTNQASLMDRRDQLIDQLSAKGGINVSFDNRGAATVRASDSGELLLSAGYRAELSASVSATGLISYSIDGGTPFATTRGSLAGFAEAASHVSDQRAGLDEMAVQFSTELNTAHQAGFDLQGEPGKALFVGTSAATLMAAALTVAQVAAADGTSGNGNGNMLALGAARGADAPEAQWSAHLAAQAQSTASARAQDAAAFTRYEGAAAARSDVSEVDLDQEAADLIRFQQAYSAAARTIQVARETMQTLLNAL
jgi:flagellar hook-associated protein 1 FlgK